MLFLDLETKSQVDLQFHGLRRYAEGDSTSVICMAYAFDDKEPKIWWADEPFPKVVINYIKNGGHIFAHNAQFEQHLFEWVVSNDYDFTPPKPEQWLCSMAVALANGYPGGLDAVTQALGLKYQKRAHGARMIREYCAPGHLTEFKPGDKELMGDYCIYDVKVMREMLKCMRPLTEHEWSEYHLSTRINSVGIPVDVDLCTAALGYANAIADEANALITTLTGGMMTKHAQRKGRDAWLMPKLTEDHINMLVVYKKGVKKMSLDQDHRGYLLACDDLDPDARELLELIDNAGSSALKKYAVAAHMHSGGRVFNTFLWNGAATGRYSGKGLQPHNFRRDAYSEDEAEPIIEDIIGGYEIDNPSNTMARLLRSMITHPDGIYYVDWSAIEGRVAPWLADSPSGEAKLDLYRAEKDVYVVTAAKMFDKAEADIDKAFRQSGKIAELSLQFGGSHNALIRMARNYGTTFDEITARDIVVKWRRANPWAEQIWHDYDRAIEAAVQAPSTAFTAGRVKFYSDGVNFLWVELPSGRFLSYPKPKWEPYTTPWGAERVGPTFQISLKPAAGEPPMRNHLRGVLVYQNCVQGCAADLLRRTLVEADAEELMIIGHVHDEVIGQGSLSDGELLNEIMLENPWWSKGLPLATGGVERGRRYGK